MKTRAKISRCPFSWPFKAIMCYTFLKADAKGNKKKKSLNNALNVSYCFSTMPTFYEGTYCVSCKYFIFSNLGPISFVSFGPLAVS